MLGGQAPEAAAQRLDVDPKTDRRLNEGALGPRPIEAQRSITFLDFDIVAQAANGEELLHPLIGASIAHPARPIEEPALLEIAEALADRDPRDRHLPDRERAGFVEANDLDRG